MASVNKTYVLQILKINGLSTDSSDAEIESVLATARISPEAAKRIVKSIRDPLPLEEKEDTLLDFTRTDGHLSPDAIRNLLGIDMVMDTAQIEALHARRSRSSIMQMVSIFIYSTVLALAGIVGAMWYYQIGVFYPGL